MRFFCFFAQLHSPSLLLKPRITTITKNSSLISVSDIIHFYDFEFHSRMSISASESSSGCESGWTLYLDQSSSIPATQWQKAKLEDENDEDLSMVSDASSGPPHLQEEEDDEESFNGNGLFSSPPAESALAKKSNKNQKIVKKQGKQKRLNLDDTASSHDLSFSKKNLNQSKKNGSMGFSATTQYKGKSALSKPFGFFNSSHSEKP